MVLTDKNTESPMHMITIARDKVGANIDIEDRNKNLMVRIRADSYPSFWFESPIQNVSVDGLSNYIIFAKEPIPLWLQTACLREEITRLKAKLEKIEAIVSDIGVEAKTRNFQE